MRDKDINKWPYTPILKSLEPIQAIKTVEYINETYVFFDPRNPDQKYIYRNYGWKKPGVVYLSVIETNNDIFWYIHTIRVIYTDVNHKILDNFQQEEFDWSGNMINRIELITKEKIITFPKNVRPLPK